MQFLPLSKDHTSNNIVPSNTLILLLGTIQLPNFGSASGVLYDGNTFTPYLLTSTSSGSPGTIYTFFSQNTQSFSTQGHVPIGWVIVIALAISLFLIILLVIGGVIADRIRRAQEGYTKAPMSPAIGEGSLERIPPEALIGDMEERRRGYGML